uniref:Uncharacterized protein n=1 Tax=Aplanochytrium stocchinoi TaxID=215587 RepID=A0A7S3UZW1_9STRA
MANSAPNIHDFIGNADELIGFNSISDFTGSLKNVQFESKSREEWENFRNKIRAILTMMALHVDDDYRSHHFTSCMDLQDDTHRFGDLTAEGILLSIFQTHCAGKAAKSIQSTIEDIHLGAYDKLCTVYSILDATNSGSAQGTIAADKLNTAKRQRDQSIQDFNKDYFNLYEEYERQGRSKDVQTCIQDYCNAVIGNEKQYSEIILNTIQNWTEAVQRAAHSNLQQAQTALQEVIERRWKDGVIPITQAQSIGFSAQQQSTKNYNRNQNFNNNSRVKACSHCGKQGCRPGPQCQAQGKICKGCGKLNHFKRCCRLYQQPGNSTGNNQRNSGATYQSRNYRGQPQQQRLQQPRWNNQQQQPYMQQQQPWRQGYQAPFFTGGTSRLSSAHIQDCN